MMSKKLTFVKSNPAVQISCNIKKGDKSGKRNFYGKVTHKTMSVGFDLKALKKFDSNEILISLHQTTKK